MSIRYSKTILIFVLAFFVSMIVIGNITDYSTNFAFVNHVMSMDTIFPDSSLKYRAITNPVLHHSFYLFIITFESVIAILFWFSFIKMFIAIKRSSTEFKKAKHFAIVPLTLGFLLWQAGFMTVGGEWFSMWQSKTWNGYESAFRIVMLFLASLIYITMENE